MTVLFFVLVIAVIFVNGFTDAPNAIASAIATRAIKKNTAVLLAAVMNFIGIYIFVSFFPFVAQTITEIAYFDITANEGKTALISAMLSIVLWAVIAWKYGIPTSESHALIAGLTGAGIAITGDFSLISADAWAKVILGLFISLGAGAFSAFALTKAMCSLFKNRKKKAADAFFNKGQTAAALISAFMHGAQDGQKFIGVMMLMTAGAGSSVPFYMTAICACTMALGTLMGGGRIIKKIGLEMASIKNFQGFASDIGSIAVMLASTFCGIPQSTTHTKSAAIAGAGAAVRLKSVDMGILKEMLLAWVITFPLCAFLAFIMTKVFLLVF